MKKYLQLLLIGTTIAVTAFAVGSQPKAAQACADDSCCATNCAK